MQTHAYSLLCNHCQYLKGGGNRGLQGQTGGFQFTVMPSKGVSQHYHCQTRQVGPGASASWCCDSSMLVVGSPSLTAMLLNMACRVQWL